MIPGVYMESDEKPPTPVLAYNQITSVQSMRALVTTVLLSATVWLLASGQEVPGELLSLTSLAIGTYFDISPRKTSG